MGKKVIFLGAGASKADGAPLQAELFASFVNSTKHNRAAYYEERRKNAENYVFKYLQEFFGIYLTKQNDELQIDNAVFPTFEEALGIIDLALSRNESYRNHTKTLELYRKNLVFSMALAIQYELDIKSVTNAGERYHSKLVKNLRPLLLTNDISIVSTNYDLLIDNAIEYEGLSCNYGFENNTGYLNTVPLLKIHGSLNWLYCPACKSIETRSGQKTMIAATLNPNGSTCHRCKSSQTSMVVPPTYYKDMSNPYLQRVYECAEQKLIEAEEIIFCGYSFPDADMHIKYLLKRAELNGLREGKLKIRIINNGCSEDEEWRIKRFFGRDVDLIFEKDASFQNFAENPFKYFSIGVMAAE